MPAADRRVSAAGTGRAPRWLARGLLVLPGLVVAGILVSLMVNCARPLTNTDTYFHLRFGEEFLDGWSLRHPGTVSTFATQSWVPTQWLSQMAMASTERWFGLPGVAWLSGLLEIGLFLAVYLAARQAAGALGAAVLTAGALYACQFGLSMRPQVVSYLLVAVTTAAWLRTRHDSRPRWWLVPLTWLWAMLHGMWPVALVIGLVAVAGLALDRAPRRIVLRALGVPVLSAAAAAVTPVGPQLYGQIVAVGHRSSFFAEWLPPDYTKPSDIVLAALMAVTLVAMSRRPGSSWTEILLVVLAGALAVYSTRTVPLAAVMLAPLAAGPVQGLVEPLARRTTWGRREAGLLAGGCVLSLVSLAVAVPHTSDRPLAEPGWLGRTLTRLPPGTKVLDDWGLGGYLMWRYPKLDLVMHGYGDTFTTAELRRNEGMETLDPGWDADLRSTGARVAVLRPYARLTYALVNQEGWRLVRESSSIAVLRAPAGWQAFQSPRVDPSAISAG